MVQLCITVLGALRVFFRARGDTALEILALRPQLAVLKRQRPRPPWKACDRWFGMALRRLWSRWAEVLLMVKPETVVGWHGAVAGFATFTFGVPVSPTFQVPL